MDYARELPEPDVNQVSRGRWTDVKGAWDEALWGKGVNIEHAFSSNEDHGAHLPNHTFKA